MGNCMSSQAQVIKDKLKTQKIANMQLDPNGRCNVGCWYCPVRYHGNPEHAKTDMPKELLRKILQNIVDEREKEDGLVSKNFEVALWASRLLSKLAYLIAHGKHDLLL